MTAGPTAANPQRLPDGTEGETDGRQLYVLYWTDCIVCTVAVPLWGPGGGHRPLQIVAIGLPNLAVLLTHCGQLILRKNSNFDAIRYQILRLKFKKSISAGAQPQTPLGELIALPQTPFYRLTALCPGLPGWAGTRKVKPNWILLKQETVSSIDICWAICKSAPRSR